MLSLTPTQPGERAEKRSPICRVTAAVNAPDITTTPSTTDVYKYLMKCLRHVVESSKAFVRWMHGWCKECPQPADDVPNKEEVWVPTFYEDTSRNPVLIKTMLSLNQGVHRTLGIVTSYLDTLLHFRDIFGLWSPKRRQKVNEVLTARPLSISFDGRLAALQTLMRITADQPSTQQVGFVLVDCGAVAAEIASEATVIKNESGSILQVGVAALRAVARARVARGRFARRITHRALRTPRGPDIVRSTDKAPQSTATRRDAPPGRGAQGVGESGGLHHEVPQGPPDGPRGLRIARLRAAGPRRRPGRLPPPFSPARSRMHAVRVRRSCVVCVASPSV